MSISAIGSTQNAYSANSTQYTSRPRPPKGDPSEMFDKISQDFLSQSDSDGNGLLSATELSGLSTESFNKLDTDSDGSLSTDEIKQAMKTQMEAMKSAESSGTGSTEATAESELMELMRSNMPPPPPPPSGSSGIDAYQDSSWNYSFSGRSGSSGLNITA